MRFIWQYLKPHFKYVIFCLIGSLGMVAVNLGLPTILGWMIDRAILPGDTSLFWRYAIMMAAAAVVGFLGRMTSAYSASKAVNLMTRDIRNDVYGRLMDFSHEEYKQFGVSSLTTRITNDAFVLLQYVEQMVRLGMTSPLMLIMSSYLIISSSPKMGVAILPGLFLLAITITILARRSKPLSVRQQENLDRINGIFRENIAGIRVIRSFTQEKQRHERFLGANAAYRDNSIQLNRLIYLMEPIFTIIINLLIVLIVIMGALEIRGGNIEVGTLTAFVEYSFHALFSLMMFSQIFMMYPRASVSARRLQEIMETETSIDENLDGATEGDGSGTVVFDRVYFQYPDADEPVLRDISFTAKRGQTTAFIGSTGSGKSTIIQLIPRLYDVTGGRILLDGVDVRDYNIHALRDKIGYTPQKALLFSGTIADNLRYGKADAQEADFDHATGISQAHEFIQGLEDKYEAELSEGATNLSGGQKQRLSIARTIIDQPDIYIFDDSFSALDYKTDAKVRDLLKGETENALTFVVAQRISSIINADQIILLNEGEIIDIGTHRELLDRSSLYQEIAATQLSEEELAHE